VLAACFYLTRAFPSTAGGLVVDLMVAAAVATACQAGLSWSTILARRECYRTAFEGFDPVKVAAFDDAKLTQLMAEGSGVVRHKGKLESAVQNAK